MEFLSILILITIQFVGLSLCLAVSFGSSIIYFKCGSLIRKDYRRKIYTINIGLMILVIVMMQFSNYIMNVFNIDYLI